MKSQAKGTLLTVLSAVVFGFNPVFTKTAIAAGCTAMTIMLIRLVCGSVIFFVSFHVQHRGSIRLTAPQLGRVALCALGYVSATALLFNSYAFIPTGLATTIHFIYPVLILLGCVLFCGERVSRRMLVCCALCMAGVACLYTPGGGVSELGVILAALSAFAFSFYTIYYGASGLHALPMNQTMFWMCATAALISLAPTAAMRAFSLPGTFRGWAFAVLSASLSSCAMLAFQTGNKYVGAQRASLLSVFEPVTSVVVGVLLYREALSLRASVGIACVLVSVCLVAFAPRRQTGGRE